MEFPKGFTAYVFAFSLPPIAPSSCFKSVASGSFTVSINTASMNMPNTCLYREKEVGTGQFIGEEVVVSCYAEADFYLEASQYFHDILLNLIDLSINV